MKRLIRSLRGQVAGAAGWAVLATGVSTLSGILTARALGPENRGTLALVVSIAGLCVLLAAFGTNVAIRRHLPQRAKVNRRGYERISLILLIPLAVILASTLYVVQSLVDPSFGRWTVGIAFVGYGLFFFFSNQALDLLNAVGLVKASAKVNALGSIICLALLAGTVGMGLGLEYMVWAYSASVFCQAVLAFGIAVRSGGAQASGAKGAGVLLRDGGRFLGHNLGQSLTYRSDTILVGALSGQHQVGNYAVATTPAAVLRIPSNAVGQVIFHGMAAGTMSRAIVLRKICLLLCGLIPLALVGWLVADWLFPAVFGSDYIGAVWPFRILLVAELALIPFLVLGRALAGGGQPWGASVCGIAGVVVLLATCLVLVPGMGATGAALSSVCAYATMSCLALGIFLKGQDA